MENFWRNWSSGMRILSQYCENNLEYYDEPLIESEDK